MKYKGIFATDFRGKIAGMVGSKSRFGNYFRRLVTPVNPRTQLQLLVRAGFATITKAWGTLTDLQREGWTILANDNPQTDIYGDASRLTGANMFMSVNLPLFRVGIPRIEDPPTDLVVRSLNSGGWGDVINPATTTVDVTFDPTPLDANEKLWVEIAENVAPGVSFVENLYKFNSVSAAAATDPNSITLSAVPVEGKIYHIKVSVLNTDNGQRSQPLSDSIVVTATP